MTLIEALEAALKDGMGYCWTGCDSLRVLKDELDCLRDYFAEHQPTDEPSYAYREASIYRISPLDGIEDEVYCCETEEERRAAWEAENA